MQRPVRRCAVQSTQTTASLHLRRSPAGALDILAARGPLAKVRANIAAREPNMWRYREVMPLFDGETPITLGEGWTPLIPRSGSGASYSMTRLFIKDESLNPTNSFKARGLSAAVTRAAHLGQRTLSVPSAGNAANAMAAYAAAAGLDAKVFMPKDVKIPFVECELYGAEVTLVDGLITTPCSGLTICISWLSRLVADGTDHRTDQGLRMVEIAHQRRP